MRGNSANREKQSVQQVKLDRWRKREDRNMVSLYHVLAIVKRKQVEGTTSHDREVIELGMKLRGQVGT